MIFFAAIYFDSMVMIPEAELMKERFAKLLLGEDMSGGRKGVCTALAISNAITNLAGIYGVYLNYWFLPVTHVCGRMA